MKKVSYSIVTKPRAVHTFEVTFGAGINYSKLIEALKEKKMALLGLPSLPHINVVGSIVTGTHSAGLHK